MQLPLIDNTIAMTIKDEQHVFSLCFAWISYTTNNSTSVITTSIYPSGNDDECTTKI